MIIRDITPTPGLLAMLRSRQDDDREPLRVAIALIVTHSDGSELSETEATHVRATIAAHKVQPL